MKNLSRFFAAAMLTVVISFGSILAETAKPTIVMGTKTVIAGAGGAKFVICPEPYDKVCVTCTAHKNTDNTAIFYVSGDESGYGFTGVEVVVLIDGPTRTVKVIPLSGYTIYTSYAAWKLAVGE